MPTVLFESRRHIHLCYQCCRLKQVEEQTENLQQALHEMSKPLARYASDKDLDQHLRNQEREGDPMLEYIRSKKPQETTKSERLYCLF
jgi:pre-mRNA-splicing factor CWC26